MRLRNVVRTEDWGGRLTFPLLVNRYVKQGVLALVSSNRSAREPGEPGRASSRDGGRAGEMTSPPSQPLRPSPGPGETDFVYLLAAC